MVRKIYSEYEYIDPEGIYTDRKIGILKNKFNEEDKDKLRVLEYRIVSEKLLELFINPIEVRSVGDICKIHEFLFSDIYPWAGEFRKVNISKSGKSFIPIQSFHTAENYLNFLIDDYIKTTTTKEGIIDKLCEMLDNLNYFHPFREKGR